MKSLVYLFLDIIDCILRFLGWRRWDIETDRIRSHYDVPWVNTINGAETLKKASVDVNHADKIYLEVLPGFTPTMASKAIARREYKHFDSVDEFITLMRVKPQFEGQVRFYIRCGEQKEEDTPDI